MGGLSVVLAQASYFPREKWALDGEPLPPLCPSVGPGYYVSAMVRVERLSPRDASRLSATAEELAEADQGELVVDLLWMTAEGVDIEGVEVGELGARAATEVGAGGHYRWIPLEEPLQPHEKLHLVVRIRRSGIPGAKPGETISWVQEVDYVVVKPSRSE